MAQTKGKTSSPLMRLMAYMGNRKLLLVLAVISAVISTMLGLVPYLIVYVIAEKVLGTGAGWIQGQSYLNLGVIALLAILGKGWLYALATKMAHLAAFPVLYDIRIQLAKKLATLPLGYFQANDTEKIKHMMNEQVEQLEEGIAHFIPDMTASTAVPFLTVVTMFLVDWRMGLAALLYVPIVYFSFKGVIKKLGRVGGSMQQLRVQVQSMVLHYVYGMKVIKAFARSEESFDQFRSVIEDTAEKMKQINLGIVQLKGIVVGLSRAGLLFVIPVGIWLYSMELLTLPVFIFFVLMTLSFGKTIFNVIHGGSHAMDSVNRCMNAVTAFLQEPSLMEPDQPQKPQHHAISFMDVSFAYDGETNVLRNLSFTAPEGKVTALVGTSGSGKSTIVRLVSRFWDVNSGAVKIGNVDVRNMTSLELAKQVSCVFQDVFLFNDTILENIRIGKSDATEEEVVAAAKAARCHEFIMELPDGYQTIVGEHGGRLSGGQRQRISIARAFLKDAPILLLDEATAYVDAENEARIQEALSELLNPIDRKPKTLIVVAHRLGTIVNADQILVIHKGQVEAAGTHEQLLGHSSRYSSMWQAFVTAEQGLTTKAKQQSAAEMIEITSAENDDVEYLRNNLGGDTATNTKQGTEEGSDPYKELTGNTSYWQKLQALAGPERKQLLRACVYPFLAAPLISLTTIAVVLIIDALMNGQTTVAWSYAGLLLLSLFGQVILTIMSFREFERYDSAVTRRLRIYLGKHLRRMPMGFFIGRDAGTIQTRLTTDVAGISVYDSIAMVIRGIVAPVLLFIVMVVLDWRLALFALLGIPVYF